MVQKLWEGGGGGGGKPPPPFTIFCKISNYARVSTYQQGKWNYPLETELIHHVIAGAFAL